MALDQSLLDRIASSLRTSRASLPPPGQPGAAAKDSILARAAELYAVRPGGEDTPPTGFDPAAAALFEALVEGAFLIAHADGDFDSDERAAFEHVVLSATRSASQDVAAPGSKHVAESQLSALLEDLGQLFAEDGLDKRIDVVAKTVAKPEQQREVLRVAALIGYISGGVSDVERAAMGKLATAFGLGIDAVDAAIGEAQRALEASA